MDPEALVHKGWSIPDWNKVVVANPISTGPNHLKRAVGSPLMRRSQS